MRVVLVLFFAFTSFCFSQSFWEQTNGPYAPGVVRSIHVGVDGKVYVGVEEVGLYCSEDNGKSFSYLSGALSNTWISSILFDQHGHIFVGGEAYYAYIGVYKSIDGGKTWTQVLPFQAIRAMTVDTSGNIYAGTSESGIFRSTDDGNSWNQLNLDSTISWVNSLALDPFGNVFASGWEKYGSYTRALRSSDKGITWDTLTIPSNTEIINFAFSPDGHIVASFRTYPGRDYGFLTSSDHGSTWIQRDIASGSSVFFGALVFDAQSSSFFSVSEDLTSTNVDLIQSTDFGLTWSTISHITNDQGFQVYIGNNKNGYFFAGDYNGLKLSTDYGSSWMQADSGFIAPSVDHLTLLPGGKVYTGTAKGVFKLADDKKNWLKDSGLVGSFLISKTGNYFLSDGKVHKSSDNGKTWKTIFETNSVSPTQELAKLSNGFILGGGGWNYGVHGTGSSKIFLSTDDGNTWNSVYSNGPDGLILTVATTPNDIIVADGGGKNGGVVRSTDFGTSWSLSIEGLPQNIKCKAIRVSPDGVIFMVTTYDGIFRSSDEGISWNAINNGLNSLSITSIAFNSRGKVFAGTAGGVFESTDNGDHWSSLNDGLLDISVLSILCDSLDYLYVATNAAGVFRSLVPTTDVEEIQSNVPLTNYLSQNYPNPFNPTTTISFTIPSSQMVELKVYDMLGREVAELINEYRQTGSYSTQFNASHLASGIYFYKIKAGKFIQTKKLILLK